MSPITSPSVQVERPKHPELRRLAGVDEAKRFGENLANDLAAYKAGQIEWSDIDPGCLFYGPPGTGKTTVAKAIAAHSDAGYIETSYAAWAQGTEGGNDIVANIRATFALARKHAPCILFIDEVDTFPRRGYGAQNAAYFTTITNALLTEFGNCKGVVVLAACNDISNLDPALIRSGRLDQKIQVPLPSPKALCGILTYLLGSDKPRIRDTERLSLLCVGKSGADLARIVRKAKRSARAAKTPIASEHLEQAITEELCKLPPEQRKVIAVHEAGHAALAYRQNAKDEIVVSLASAAAARTTQHDSSLKSRERIEQEMIVLLAGRAAEEVLVGEVSGGAGGGEDSDLARATRIAIDAICRHGMSAQGHLFWYSHNAAPGLIEAQCGPEADAWLSDAYQAAVAQVSHNAVFIAMIAYTLLDRGVLTSTELAHIDRSMEKIADTHTKAEILAALGFPQPEKIAAQ
jgi:ATP-dependent Zn protease